MSLKVFLVEDMGTMRGLIEEACAALGDMRVVGWAGTEAEARLWLDDNARNWDLAVVDLVLEQGSGFGVLEHMNRQPARGKAVVFSSYVTPGVRDRCVSLGADAAFDKGDGGEFLEWLAAAPA